jgi:hypothetical protein
MRYGVGTYAGWLELAQTLIRRIAPGHTGEVLAGTAARDYRLQ